MNFQNEDIKVLISKIIEESKFKNLSKLEKETLEKKVIKKYLNDFNYTALQMLNSQKKVEFSKILETNNQNDIDTYISENIEDLKLLSKNSSKKFSKELFQLLEM